MAHEKALARIAELEALNGPVSDYIMFVCTTTPFCQMTLGFTLSSNPGISRCKLESGVADKWADSWLSQC